MTLHEMPARASAVLTAAVSPTAASAECTRKRDPGGEVVVAEAERVGALAPHHGGQPLGLADRRVRRERLEVCLVVHDDEHEGPRAQLGLCGFQQDLQVSFAGHAPSRFSLPGPPGRG